MSMQPSESSSTMTWVENTSDERRRIPLQRRLLGRPLSIAQVLAWADAHFARHRELADDQDW